MGNTEDTSTWLPLDGLAPGFDENRAPHSRKLAGREVTVLLAGGERVWHEFGADTVRWWSGERVAEDACEVFEVDTDLYYVSFHRGDDPAGAVSLVLDLSAGRTLLVRSAIGEPDQRPTVVTQSFHTGTVEGVEPTGEPPAPSGDLLGRRVLWSYSREHHYEHVYLSEHWYSFHCLSGPERGLADTDACAYYRIRPGIYLFAWREKVIPCAAVTVADHRLFRSHGTLFGLHEDGVRPVHFTFGAHGRLLSNTIYPAVGGH
ncbi:molybdenum cofactor biosynthesis protein MoaF [Solihabitans fulvus]|uniref:Molybdenum cofactor biosynthesis protein MoaF n=1 Tax=Solihabitans fulvus TaxID=1892852 RepID=A0A5B2XWU2_9PSEU|nr:MoaF C-terminal domain-containing protein [Solihabitans fulvus]KAA2267154.1 molybdenum cofactor biosynthesis protein MoaF [Solihabitans fulvus]